MWQIGVDVVKYLVEHGAKIDHNAIKGAVDYGYKDIAEYLEEQIAK